jgi:hypothetical protein
MSTLKYILLAGLVLFILIIGVFYIALAPTIRNLSGKPEFKQWVGRPLTLQYPGRVHLYPKAQYSFYPHVLTGSRNPGYPLTYELPAGTVITIRSFKTYTNNMGSGTTALYALGDFVTKEGKQVTFQYAWSYEERLSANQDREKLPLAIWQTPGETQVEYDL